VPASPSADSADAPIIDALDQGDLREALRRCAEVHASAIGRVCMALTGSQAEAEDLTQETLLAAHAGLGGWRRDGTLRAWLLTIARRSCARHLERRTLRDQRLRLIHDSSRADPADDLVAERQRAERARQALEQIRPSEREAVILRYVGELSFREVALACNIDEGAARKRVSRALARLRETLSSED
jgi:RNA polymerase sigma-70 factor (ECF subfamily)